MPILLLLLGSLFISSSTRIDTKYLLVGVFETVADLTTPLNSLSITNLTLVFNLGSLINPCSIEIVPFGYW